MINDYDWKASSSSEGFLCEPGYVTATRVSSSKARQNISTAQAGCLLSKLYQQTPGNESHLVLVITGKGLSLLRAYIHFWKPRDKDQHQEHYANSFYSFHSTLL